MNSSGKDPK